MTSPRYARLLARLLAQSTPEQRIPTREQRARSVLEIERALAAKRGRRHLRKRLLVGASAAAALVLLWGGTRLVMHGSVSASLPDRPDAPALVTIVGYPEGSGAEWQRLTESGFLTQAREIEEGTRIRANEAGAVALKFSTGTAFELESRSSLQVKERGALQRFQLDSGSLKARVARLEPTQRLVVETPDAVVEVRGTEFELSVLDTPRRHCTPETRTDLAVQEGVVEVRALGATVLVRPGEHWPVCKPQVIQSAPVPSTGPASPETSLDRPGAAGAMPEVVPREHKPPPAQATPKPDSAEQATSSLVAQNDLFAEGVAARKRGDRRAALAAYNRLLSEYPGSALVENAMVEKLRLLASTHSSEAPQAAEQYLRRFPQGFARDEARRIAERQR